MAKPKPVPQPVVIPAGTVLTVRLEQALGSKTSKAGERFQATVAHAIVQDGKTVIPTGATAGGAVTEAHEAGRVKGGATLAVALDTLTIGGKEYKIQAMPVEQSSTGKGKRTGAMAGGGAGAGALIGGLTGGGKGAGIGAAVGAATGLAGSALTGDRNISLPVETALDFQLSEALTLPPRPPKPAEDPDMEATGGQQ
jgi:hypothetical protein